MLRSAVTVTRAWVVDPRNQRRLAWAALGLILVYGALLRFDAITLGYGPVARPAWLKAVQASRPAVSLLRPASVTWPPVPKYPHAGGDWTQYAGDSYTYLQYAREMQSFFGAHYREPVFVYATRVWLWVLRNQDVAVSFASAMFSVLCIAATYLLGAYAFTRPVGLLAALGMAIEIELVSEGVIGVRDDAFVCAVLGFAWACLRQMRAPSRANAMLVGVLAGAAFLTRVFAAVFVAPALVWMILVDRRPWQHRLRSGALMAGVAMLVVAPYIFNCWRVLGDPLPAFNVHASIYSAVEGKTAGAHASTAGYILGQIRERPMRVADTVALGLTAYPFQNKWHGFEQWVPGAGRWIAVAALAGLFLFVGSADGRMLLLVLVTSLVPFAFTWKLISEWRFTQHAYPFFLIGASLVAVRGVGAIGAVARWTRGGAEVDRRAVAMWVGAALLVLSAIAVVTCALPVLTLREAVRMNEPITLIAGERDWMFFGSGWSNASTGGSVSWRVAEGATSRVRVPLSRVQTYSVTLRIDPYPVPASLSDPLPTVRVGLNGQALATVALTWNAQRVGAYELELPASRVFDGLNELSFSVEPRPGGPNTIRLWLVRIRPPGA